MKKAYRFFGLVCLIYALSLLSSCFLFVNKYSPPSWLIGTWESPRTGGDYPNYDRWVVTEDNLIVYMYRVGQLSETFDYSELGYGEENIGDTYVLTSSLDDSTYEIFTRIPQNPDFVDYYATSPFMIVPEEYTLFRIE